ncbi:hypothetical protein C7M84_022136 [Penaeus vannamei]|uniref:C2H2-type domain-containing protein n=1 Tax=Penaeus vannamei TaxID=6689 RepID=A0A3R7MSC0_PENVA|nr:hypothetical protein C7M84_022136 [Penaeus vannamei]
MLSEAIKLPSVGMLTADLAEAAALIEVEAVLADEDDEELVPEDIAVDGMCGDSTPASSCRVCGKVFKGTKRKYRLERHMAIHTGEKPFPCPMCEYRANQKEHLNRHMRNLHRVLVSQGPDHTHHAHAAAT